MPRTSPTLAEIAADYTLWGECYDVDGHDSPEQWERRSFRDRLEMLQAAYDAEPCRNCGVPTYNLGGGSCANCCGEW
jgi:hypothetical protein